MNDNGYIVYEGDSLIDGSPIVAIATGFKHGSKNIKTGDIIQTWIISQTILPTTAAKTGNDTGVCGNCPLKPTNNGSCYVNLAHVNRVFNAYKNGKYKQLPDTLPIIGKVLRLGSYGEATAVPLDAWVPLIKACSHTLGYTHQWHKAKFKQWNAYLMASVQSSHEVIKANSLGYRTYRVSTNAVVSDEIVCLNQTTGINCADCCLCDGNQSGKNVNIISQVHGLKFKQNNFAKIFD